jgi:hypothetical protein
MSPRPEISKLPAEILDALNQRLVDNAFSDYAGLSDWLGEQGFSIGPKAVWNYGSKLQQSMEKSLDKARQRMAIAKALRGASEEDKAALMEANEMVAMDQIMEMFEEVASFEPADRIQAVPKLVRAIADLNRSAIGSSKWKREVQDKIQATFSKLETEASSGKPNGRKLDAETLKAVREEVYGLV